MDEAAVTERKLWRKRLIAARLALPLEERRRATSAIIDRVLTETTRLGAVIIGGYWPVRGEVDLEAAFAQVRAKGGTVALPLITAPDAPLAFRCWRQDAALIAGAYEIPHPADGRLVIPDVLLVPVVGFDAKNFRLGYGAGFYDRTIAALKPGIPTIGIGFEVSRLPDIHPEPHDAALDAMITERALYRRADHACARVEG